MNIALIFFFCLGIFIILTCTSAWLFFYFYFKKKTAFYKKLLLELDQSEKEWVWLNSRWLFKLLSTNEIDIKQTDVKNLFEKIQKIKANLKMLLNDLFKAINSHQFLEIKKLHKKIMVILGVLKKIEANLSNMISLESKKLNLKSQKFNYFELNHEVNLIVSYNAKLCRLLSKKYLLDTYNHLKTLISQEKYDNEYFGVIQEIVNDYQRNLALLHGLCLSKDLKKQSKDLKFDNKSDLITTLNLSKTQIDNRKKEFISNQNDLYKVFLDLEKIQKELNKELRIAFLLTNIRDLFGLINNHVNNLKKVIEFSINLLNKLEIQNNLEEFIRKLEIFNLDNQNELKKNLELILETSSAFKNELLNLRNQFLTFQHQFLRFKKFKLTFAFLKKQNINFQINADELEEFINNFKVTNPNHQKQLTTYQNRFNELVIQQYKHFIYKNLVQLFYDNTVKETDEKYLDLKNAYEQKQYITFLKLLGIKN